MAYHDLTSDEMVAKIQRDLPTDMDFTTDLKILDGPSSELKYWLLFRAGVVYESGKVRLLFNVSSGNDRAELKDQFDNLQTMLKTVDAKIVRARSNAGGTSTMTSTLPSAYGDAVNFAGGAGEF